MNIHELRARITEAYWVVPAGCVLAAAVLALALIELDQGLDRDGSTLAFTGGPDSARALLSAIAASMLSLTALVFSITVVVLQLASTQFSPRVLRTFLQDRQNQLTLGVFTGTFVYALLALREVRGQDGVVDRFVPGFTVSIAFVLVVVSVGFFIAFIHHITQAIRVANIVERISTETEAAIERVYGVSQTTGAGASGRPSSTKPPETIPSSRRGVITVIDTGMLMELAEASGGWIEVPHGLGAFIPAGATLAALHGSTEECETGRVQAAFSMANERSMDQDPAFGFRQLVDIAERALSPGTNDPSTAVQCMDHLHHLLRKLAEANLPDGLVRNANGSVRVVLPPVRWEDYLCLSLDEIRVWGGGSLQVHDRAHAMLSDLLAVVDGEQRVAVLEQMALFRATEMNGLPDHERGHRAERGRV